MGEISDKIPAISDLIVDNIDEETRNMEIVNKHIIKKNTARSKDPGDHVLVKSNNTTANKLIRTFSPVEYEVSERHGVEAILKDCGNKTIRRNVGHIKKIPSEVLNNRYRKQNQNASNLLRKHMLLKIRS